MADVQELDAPQVDEPQEGQSDPVEDYYNYLKKAGADVAPTLDSFKRTLSDEKTARQYYGYLKQNNFDAPPTYDSFSRTLGAANSSPIPKLDNGNFQQPMVRDNTSVQQPVQPKVDLTQTTADQLAKKQALAQTVIQKELTGNPDVARNVINRQKQQAQRDQDMTTLMQQPRSDQPLTGPQQFANRQAPPPQTPQASDQDVTDFINLAQTDPNAGRGFLNHIIDQKPDKSAPLKSAVYVNDAAARATADPTKAGKILQNAQQIEKGQLDYSPTNGLLTKPEGVWESIASGAAQKTKAFQDYDTFANATPDQAIQELEKRRAAYDPDEPIPAPKGFLASTASGMASQPTKGLVAGKVAGGVTGLIPGAEEFAPAADKFVTAAISSNDFRKMSYANSLQQNYNQLRNQGMSPQDAYEKANGQAKDESMVDAVAGGAMMYGAGAIGEIPLPKFSLSAGFQNTLVTALKQGAKGIGEAGAVGLIQGAAQDFKNKLADEKGIQHDTTGADIGEAIKSGTLFTLGMAALAKGMGAMSGITQSKLLQGLSKATPEQVNKELGGLIMDGHITPQEAQAASTAITEHRLTDASIPPNVTDDARLQIQDKIKRRDYLETQLESADKAFHPEIKEKINAVNDDILELAKNTKPRGEEDILSQKPTTDGQTEGQVNPAEGAQPESGSGAPSIQPVSDQIQPTPDFRTWDLGDMEGKPEDEAAKKHIEGVVEKWDTKPATDATDPAKQGETFGGEFLQRIIPAFDNVLKTGEPNTTITTHSSDLKAFKVWDEMGRPDITKLTDEQKKEFATRYNQQETYNGDLETFKGDKGDIHVIRHGETTDNEKNNFRSGDTNLTAKGKQQAAESGRELGRVTGGDVPKIITSDLPRAVDTSNIIHGELTGESVPRGTFHEGQNIQSTHFEGERTVTHVGDDHVVVKDPGGDHIKHEIPISDIKTQDNASTIRSDQGQDGGTGNAAETSQNPRSEDLQRNAGEKTGDAETTEQTGGATKPAGAEGSDGKLVSTKNKVADVIRDENGLPPVEIPKDRSDDESLNAWRDGTRKPQQTVDQLLSDKDIYDKSITPNDEPIMREYIRGLVNRGIELNKLAESLSDKVKEGDEKAIADQASIRQQLLNHYDEMGRALDAERIGGNIWHKYGMERQMAVNEQGQIVNSINRIKTIYGDDMPEAVKNQLSELQRRNDELTAKSQKIEEENKKLQSENELLKQNQGARRDKGAKKTDSDFTRERKDILSDMKDALKEASKKMYATLPGVPQLAAIAPHVLRLFKSFGEQGVIKLDEAVGKIHDLVKDVLEGVTKEDIKDIIQGKYTQADELKKQAESTQRKIDKGKFYKPPPIKRLWEKDPEWIKNNREQSNLKFKLRNLEKQAFDSQKSMYMKGLDWVNRWGRRVIFFGANAVYTKLSSAAVLGAFVHRPFEQLAGKINARLYPEIAKNAPIEGNINMNAEAKYYKEFLNIKKFAQNIWSQAKTGETPLSKELGRHSNEKHVPIVDLFAADVHAMIKDPVKRASFEAAVLNHLKFYADNSIDGTHPLMLESARQAAYKAAEYEIFQNSNKTMKGVNKFFNDLEKSGIVNRNLPGGYNTFKGNAQYTAASLYHFFVPVNNVPVNIFERIGLGLMTPKTMAKAWSMNKDIKNGILNMSQEDSDLLMRQLKKGQIGTAYWTLGFILGGSALGGLYTKYDPDKERGDKPKANEMDIGDQNVPKDVQHTYQFQSSQMGATWRTVYDHFIDDKGASQMEAIAKASAATAGAGLESLPALQAGVKGVEALQGAPAGEKWVKDLEKRIGIGKATSILQMMGYGDDTQQPTGGGAGASGQWTPTVKEFK